MQWRVSDYTITRADDVDDVYAGTSVPGEFRPLTRALGSDQVALTLDGWRRLAPASAIKMPIRL